MNVEISVIICTYNRDKYIYQTLKQIVLNNFPVDRYEIILINNNSTDQTENECLRFQKDFPDSIFLYFIEQQQGLSFARNRGIKESNGMILVFLDDDAFVEKDYLDNLSENLRSYPNAAAFGGKVTPQYESGEIPNWMSRWTQSWVSAIDKGPKASLFHGKSFPIGANMGFRRMSLQYGYFNTNLGRNADNLMGGEEKDLFNRLKVHHLSIYYFPNIKVTHIIPEKRTTREYIKKLALGVGKSERIRVLNTSMVSYLTRLSIEMLKWSVSLVLCLYYVLIGASEKGCMLIYFRYFVTKGLFTR